MLILPVYAQQEVPVSAGDTMVIMIVFAVAVGAVFVYLARDMILRKKTDYDGQDLGSQQDREYEKYHSDWLDDFAEIGSRKKHPDDSVGDLPDLYAIMGLPKTASADQIKQQYRRLAKQLHPDRNMQSDAREKMADINRAYEILSDPRMRARYDNVRQ